jgi:activator of HSP90 ATPase
MRLPSPSYGEKQMNNGQKPTAITGESTRRQVVFGGMLALGALATGSKPWGLGRQQTASGAPTPNDKRTSLHQQIEFKASPARIYEILLDSKQFGTVTGLPAEIDPKEGGAFKTFGGLIVGRNVELVSDQRIVQAWRPTHWDSGVYSIVRFELKPQGSGSIVILDHTGFPEGEYEHLNEGWPMRYWEPLKKFLAS